MNEKRATSYDVAKLAGVSQSAVSRVFSPNGSASKKTREKVLRAAKALGFAPNPIAKSLSLGSSRLAGLVVTQYAHQNYPVALKSAVDLIAETENALLIQIVDSTDDGDFAVRQLMQRHVDMILCAASLSREASQACVEMGIPLIMINRPAGVEGVDSVCSPNAEIMQEVAQTLCITGARRCVFLGGHKNNWVSSERFRGFREACARLGMEEPILLSEGFDYEGGRKAIYSLGETVRQFDAIVAANDAMAIGAADVLRLELGIKIPEDIQLVGHDDTQLSRLQSYQLTTVHQNMLDVFAVAIDLAMSRRAERERPDQRVIIPSAFVPRATTRVQLGNGG